MPVVRPLKPTDLDRWISLRARLWPEQSRDELTADARAFLDGAASMLEAVLVAVDDGGAAIGFAELSRRPYAEGCDTSPVGFLEGWFVAREWRGRGVGRALVGAAEEWARGRGCRELASDTNYDN